MNQTLRRERLLTELEAMQALKNVSTIFDFTANGDPPDRYLLTFRGRGLRRAPLRTSIETADEHKLEIRLSYSFPDRPPDIRWVTPIYHPNIPASGFVDPADLGLPWRPELGLDVVCERLWDVCRMEYVDAAGAANPSALKWLERQSEYSLPLDPRPLRDSKTPASQNVVRYRRRGEPEVAHRRSDPDVLYIGDDTPTPALPRRKFGDSGDVLYIGDD